MTLTVELASVPDREELVAEIWDGSDMVAEIRRDREGRGIIEVYPRHDASTWTFDIDDLISALVKAKRRV